MPLTNQHIQQAEKNEVFFSSFDAGSTLYSDWAVTALFYAALHYVDACLGHLNFHPVSHAQRTPLIRHYLPQIFQWYRELKDESEQARYQLKMFTSQQVVQYQQENLLEIRSFCQMWLSRNP